MTQKKSNANLIKALENLQDAFARVLGAHEQISTKVDLAEKYPFANSLDEVANDVLCWVENQKALLSESSSKHLFECILEDLANKTVENCGNVFCNPSSFKNDDKRIVPRLNILVKKTIYAALVEAYNLGKQSSHSGT